MFRSLNWQGVRPLTIIFHSHFESESVDLLMKFTLSYLSDYTR